MHSPLDERVAEKQVARTHYLVAWAVETAVGEPGSLHQPGETSFRDSVAQKLGARRFEYALACFGGFCF
jgi:hypothetical protein